jgi:hypothetical protein
MDRISEINNLIDTLKPYDTINDLIKKYSLELEDYKYINSVELFSILRIKGSIKYINKYDKKLRSGGLLIKIYQKDNDKWYAILKQFSGKSYTVSFDANYIFYYEHLSKSDKIRNLLDYFIAE